MFFESFFFSFSIKTIWSAATGWHCVSIQSSSVSSAAVLQNKERASWFTDTQISTFTQEGEKREQQQSKEIGLCHKERPQEVKRRVKQRRRLNLRQTDRSQQDPGRTTVGPQRDRGSSQAAPSFTVQPPFACLSGGFQPITLLLNTATIHLPTM